SGNFHNAPIDFKTKEQTEVYNYIQQINKEVKALSPIFLGARLLSISHTGKNIPSGATPLTKLPDVITKFETNGLGAIVSVLQNGERSYLVVVNQDIKKPMSLT